MATIRYYLKKLAAGKCLRCTRLRDTEFATCSVCCARRRARYVVKPKVITRDKHGRFTKSPQSVKDSTGVS